MCRANIFLSLFNSNEIETMICGPRRINIQLLKSKTKYNGYRESDEIIEWFWDILENKLTDNEQKQLFLFVWGRSRLPTRATDHTSNFTIKKQAVSSTIQSKIDQMLPLGKTCYFSMHIPNYSNKDIMLARIKYAIANCSAIDLDGVPGGDAIRRAMQEIPDDWRDN